MQIDEYFSDLASIILRFNKYYWENVLQKILETKDYSDEPKRFFYTVMHKTHNVLESANLYIHNFNIKKNYQTSLNILLRSILADIIVAEYVLISPKDDDERKILINRIYMDHVDKTYNSISRVYAKIEGLSDKEIEKAKEEFRSNRPQYFDDKGNIINKPLKTSVESIIKRIFSEKPQNKHYKLLKMAFDNYDLFSKLEHLGDLSYALTHKVYYSEYVGKGFIKASDSINIAMCALINYCNCWDPIFEDEIKNLKIIQIEFKKHSILIDEKLKN